MSDSPSADRRPDFANLRRTLLRDGPPGPVPFIELFIDPGLVQAVLGEPVSWDPLLGGESRSPDAVAAMRAALEALLRFSCKLGYDYVWAWTGLRFPRANFQVSGDSAALANWLSGVRFWQDESAGPIQNWADFESYPWPRAEHISFAGLEYLAGLLPEGMKINVNIGGIFEESSWLMGLQSFSYALHDEPELVAAICERVGELAVAAARNAAAIDGVGLVFLGDDLGHVGGTLVSPQTLERHIFPHYRTMAESVHAAGKLLLLHSCGNLARVMDDIIAAGFDGKHSFEDKIMPVEEVHRRWGDRIAILGGVDMDLLARGSEAEVRRRTRTILETCAARGTGYCLGTGNSGANYIPVGNFLAMLEEGREWNRENHPQT